MKEFSQIKLKVSDVFYHNIYLSQLNDIHWNLIVCRNQKILCRFEEQSQSMRIVQKLGPIKFKTNSSKPLHFPSNKRELSTTPSLVQVLGS
jgi:hypothetical protein